MASPESCTLHESQSDSDIELSEELFVYIVIKTLISLSLRLLKEGSRVLVKLRVNSVENAHANPLEYTVVMIVFAALGLSHAETR